MIQLLSTTTLEIILAGAVTTNQLQFDNSFADYNATARTFGPSTTPGVTNNTTAVTMIAAPAAPAIRQIKWVNVLNSDTVAATLTIRKNIGGTFRNIITVTLQPTDRLQYIDSTGWSIMSADGSIRGPGISPTLSSGFKNFLMNPLGTINQRSFAGGALAAGVYGYDRWKADTGGAVVSNSAGLWTITSGTIVQVIESPNLANQVVTVSIENPTATVNVNVEGLTGSITSGTGRRSISFTIPGGSTGNITVKLGGTATTYRDPQLEIGPASSFERRFAQIELDFCMRYFESRGFFSTGYNTAGATIDVDVPFTVPKRTTPAIVWLTAGYTNSSGITTVSINTVRFIPRFTVTATGSATFNGSWTADAEL